MTDETPKVTPEMLAGAIVCYAKCWPCNFGEHLDEPHTWMDEDDMESAGVTVPDSTEDWVALAREKPCGCHCMKRHREAS